MSDSDEDDNAYYGTPLEELDEDEIRSRKAPRIEDQFARDKQGRRRFHGAFTGGFSAGYFNSVGTKEGWTPSTFVSSKGQRAKTTQSKPHNFMDDEDLAAYGISPQGLQTSANFDDSEQKKRKRVLDPGGPIPGAPVLEDILKPSRETMGMKLLRRLGWKPGQGVGPRISRRQKMSSHKEKTRMYGCQGPEDALRDSDSESEGDEAHLQNVTFAPDDVDAVYLSKPKTDCFGLGYKPLNRTSVLGGHINLFDPSPLVMTERKKKVLIKGQAFGVGAFEDEDEDIYATEDMSNYDFSEEKRDAGHKGTKNKDQLPTVMLGLVDMIEGFKLSSHPPSHHKIYPPPIIPQDFLPQHKPRRRRFERKESEMHGLGRHDMTVEQRAKRLAECSKTTVEVRSGVKGEPQHLSKKESKSSDTFDVDKIYEEFQNSQTKLSSDFKPFAKEPEKQRRYELFLRMKEKGRKDQFYLAQPTSMTEWQKDREMQEFSRAAKLFQPLSSTMATRFVSAVTEDSGPVLKDGLNINVPKVNPVVNESDIDTLGENIADERIKAAKMNMFGKLTQSSVDWYPDRLLCRRFNVPDPYPESSFVGVRKSKREKFSIFNLLNAPVEDTAGSQEASPMSQEKEKEESAEVENFDDKPETFGLKVPVDGPPTMDLFKAIFQDSESGSDSDSEDEKTTDIKTIEEEESTIKDAQPEKLNSSKHTLESDMDTSDSVSAVTGSESLVGFVKGRKINKDATDDPVTLKECNRQRVRISRFEPERGISSTQLECLPKPVFVHRRKDLTASEVPPAKGIFANIDFEALNSYRNIDATSSQEQSSSTSEKVKESISKGKKTDSGSSVDSEDEYGPPVPVHLKNRIQMIRSPPPPTAALVQNLREKQDTVCKQNSWVEKEPKTKTSKKHKYKDKHRYKKEKKKKKDRKNKKHKQRKKKKEHRHLSRRNSSSSSNSDSSDSD